MILYAVCRPQYFISHTKSQRLLVTRHRLSCEKVNLHKHTRNVSLGHLRENEHFNQLFCPSIGCVYVQEASKLAQELFNQSIKHRYFDTTILVYIAV